MLDENFSVCHECKYYIRDDEGEYCDNESPNLGTEDGCFMCDRSDPEVEKEDNTNPDLTFYLIPILI